MGFKEHITLTPKLLYQAVENYIKEDHVDGEGNEEDHIVTYGTESSYSTEDTDGIETERVVIVADFGEEEGTQTVVQIEGIENTEAMNTLLKFVKDPYGNKM